MSTTTEHSTSESTSSAHEGFRATIDTTRPVANGRPARSYELGLKVEVTFLLSPHPVGHYDQIQRWPNGNVCFLLDGELHRVGGPAFIGADGSMTWLQNGREHRAEGPAVFGPDGELEYWFDGQRTD